LEEQVILKKRKQDPNKRDVKEKHSREFMEKACRYALKHSHKKAAIKFGIEEQNTRRWLLMYFDDIKIQECKFS